MVSHHEVGSEFDGTLRYLHGGRRDQPGDKRVELLGSRGIGTGSVQEMIDDFNEGRQANPALKKAVWHISLSFNPADAARLDSQKMLEITEQYLEKMGLANTQYLILRHHDRPGHQHVHIVANRVDDEGKTVADGRNYSRSRDILRELVQQHGLTPPGQGEAARQHPEQLQGSERVRHELRQTLREVLTTATQLPELSAALQARGVTTRYRYNQANEVTGISFAKDGVACKGSELAREYSLRGIQGQLAANRQQQDAVEQAAVGRAAAPGVRVVSELKSSQPERQAATGEAVLAPVATAMPAAWPDLPGLPAVPQTAAEPRPADQPPGRETGAAPVTTEAGLAVAVGALSPGAATEVSPAAVLLAEPAGEPAAKESSPAAPESAPESIQEYHARLDRLMADWETGWTPEAEQAAWDEDWDRHWERVE